jgi:hypothetical protein
MKINNLLTCFFASALLLVASCNDDDFDFENQEKSYSGILVSNEGNFEHLAVKFLLSRPIFLQ